MRHSAEFCHNQQLYNVGKTFLHDNLRMVLKKNIICCRLESFSWDRFFLLVRKVIKSFDIIFVLRKNIGDFYKLLFKSFYHNRQNLFKRGINRTPLKKRLLFL